MITEYYQQVWVEGDDRQIKFSYTSLNDPDELPGLQLLEVDGEDQFRTPSRIWEQCQNKMDITKALNAEEMYRW